MEPIQYVNEHLWVHYCGHAFLILAFFSGIYTLVSGIVSVNKNEAENSEWLKAVKIGFLFHVVFIFLSIVLIFFMMDRHYYWRGSISFQLFGKAKREVFCFGCFGTLCWDYFFGKA